MEKFGRSLGFRRSAFIAPLLVIGFGVMADDRGRVALDIDALVRVNGMPAGGTEVFIIPAEGRVEHLVGAPFQFDRALDLQTTYLLSFERDGCLSKQVYIDTHVPQSYMSLSPFEFRFKVTLEERERGGDRYAGPVAFVRFNAGLSDFDYETDYRLLRDSLVFERLQLVHRYGLDGLESAEGLLRELRGSGSAEAVVPVPPASVPGVPTPDTHRAVTRVGPEGPVVHVDHTVARLLPREGGMARADGQLRPERVDRPEAGGDPEHAQAGSARSAPPPPHERSEELVVERLRVTTIVRVFQDGVTTEYRRVAHYHGGVTHFRNGVPCSEEVYRQGTDPDQ